MCAPSENIKQYEEELSPESKTEKQSQLQSVEESIARIPAEQANIAERIGKTSNEEVRNVLRKQIEILVERERKNSSQPKSNWRRKAE